MTKGEQAKEYFKSGCNCAQAVLLAFLDETGLDRETAIKASAAFGGGLGRLREVCGAVSGMSMAAGMIYGSDNENDPQVKKELYAIVQKLAGEYKEQNGSIICRDLLEGVNVTGGEVPEKRCEGYYKKRPCGELVQCAADILERYIENNK